MYLFDKKYCNQNTEILSFSGIQEDIFFVYMSCSLNHFIIDHLWERKGGGGDIH